MLALFASIVLYCSLSTLPSCHSTVQYALKRRGEKMRVSIRNIIFASCVTYVIPLIYVRTLSVTGCRFKIQNNDICKCFQNLNHFQLYFLSSQRNIERKKKDFSFSIPEYGTGGILIILKATLFIAAIFIISAANFSLPVAAAVFIDISPVNILGPPRRLTMTKSNFIHVSKLESKLLNTKHKCVTYLPVLLQEIFLLLFNEDVLSIENFNCHDVYELALFFIFQRFSLIN